MHTQANIWHPTLELLTPSASVQLTSWLKFPGSFMDRLKTFGINDSEVKVLYQDWQIPTLEELAKLGMETEPMLIREVLIKTPDKHWMYARTAIPKATLEQAEKLETLNNRAIGTILFGGEWQRDAFDFCYLNNHSSWYQKVNEHFTVQSDLWGRRSLFYHRQHKLLLTEIFLPDIGSL